MQKTLIALALVLTASGALAVRYYSPASSSVNTATPLLPAAGEAASVSESASGVSAVKTAVLPAPAPTVSAPAPAPVPLPVPKPIEVPAQAAKYPVKLSIPSIKFSNPIVNVGTNARGEMDVPSGTTQNVGWYAPGVVPGAPGSAVIGAHVFAAFKNLDRVKPGDEIYVTMDNGEKRRFVVTLAKTYLLSDMSADGLFNRAGGRYLHLITCAGEPTADGSTYTHRRVVYATLAE